MKILFPVIAFVLWAISGMAFSYNWGGCNEVIYTIDGAEKYTYGELIYQMGIEAALLLLFIYARLGAKGWMLKLIFNWFVEILLITTYFMLQNPYSINWDKILLLKVSIVGMIVLYTICVLFPPTRRLII